MRWLRWLLAGPPSPADRALPATGSTVVFDRFVKPLRDPYRGGEYMVCSATHAGPLCGKGPTFAAATKIKVVNCPNCLRMIADNRSPVDLREELLGIVKATAIGARHDSEENSNLLAYRLHRAALALYHMGETDEDVVFLMRQKDL